MLLVGRQLGAGEAEAVLGVGAGFECDQVLSGAVFGADDIGGDAFAFDQALEQIAR